MTLANFFLIPAAVSLFSCLGQIAVADEDGWPRMLGPSDDARLPTTEITASDSTSDTSAKFAPPQNWSLAWSIAVGEGYGNAVGSADAIYHFDRYGDAERLSAYRLTDGQEIWKVEFPVQYRDSFGYNNGPRAMPVAGQGVVAAYGVTGTLAVVDQTDGRVLWQRPINEEYNVVPNFFGVGSTPLIDGERLIVMVGGSPASEGADSLARLRDRRAAGSGIVAFDLRSGRELYRIGNYLASYSAPVIANIDGRRVGLAFLREGLMAFDPDAGQELAFFPFRAEINESVNAAWPVVSGSEVFISETYEFGSRLLQYAGDEFHVVWADPDRRRDQAFRAHWATPVLIDGVIYGSSGRNEPDSELRAVRWSDGELLWNVRTHARSNVVAVGTQLLSVDEYGQAQIIQADPAECRVLSSVELLDSSLVRRGQLGSPIWAPPAIIGDTLLLRGGDRLIAIKNILE